jgi:hypothetical protein
MAERAGRIRLSDGTELALRIMILDIREAGVSPFGGVNFSVKAMGGITTKVVPEELRRAVADKPTVPQESSQPPQDGWELVDIVEQEPAIAEESITSSRGRFAVRVAAEATMAARNLSYRLVIGNASEPLYWVTWVYKVTWKPEVRGE